MGPGGKDAAVYKTKFTARKESDRCLTEDPAFSSVLVSKEAE